MNLLLDTHIFLWYISADKRLRKKHFDLIKNANNDVYFSVASIWECCIKQQIGKLDLPEEPSLYLSNKRILHKINSLHIDENCMKHLSNLPPIHKDPFDRIIICQAIEYKLRLITEDINIKKYKLPDLHFV